MVRILVIEDEQEILTCILNFLREENYKALGANDGELGWQLAQKELPDLIICDVTLPKMSGYEVLSALRKIPTTASIPFIFLTARTNRVDWRKGMELGADDYLTKPFRLEELQRAIATRLEKRELLQQHYGRQLRKTKEKLNQVLYYDNVTLLPNRFSLLDTFHKVVNLVDRAKIDTVEELKQLSDIAILCLNLDRFYRINDLFGYHKGDLILKQVAERLIKSVDEQTVVAYLNGAEFAIIFPNLDNRQAAIELAKLILSDISQPFYLEQQEIFLTVSIGISFYPNHGKEIEVLLCLARKAMNQAKQRKGNCYQLYSSSQKNINGDFFSLESDLHRALERQELKIYYQPQVSLQTGKIVSGEALLRWHHPLYGNIVPSKFISVAEETDLINRISKWSLSVVCQQLKLWHQEGFDQLKMAVNLSAHQFSQQNLTQQITEALNMAQLNAENLELELTESSLVQHPQWAVKKLNNLKSLGIEIAIDDFGTGYSSLAYLQQFPLDILKIDRCFIGNLFKNEKTIAITKAIIHMAHNLGMRVIAEGVETQAELDFCVQQQCDMIQGYIFSRPVSAANFSKLLQTSKILRINH